MMVQVKPIYARVYQALEQDIDEVLRDQAIQQLERRIAAAQHNVQQWENKYESDYATFAERTAIDIDYVRRLNAQFETQMWEGDSISWEFDTLELQTWQEHLQTLLA